MLLIWPGLEKGERHPWPPWVMVTLSARLQSAELGRVAAKMVTIRFEAGMLSFVIFVSLNVSIEGR